MNRPSLSSLSDEILLEIFGHFCLHCQGEYGEEWDVRPWDGRGRSREAQDPLLKSWYSLNRNALFSLSLASKRLNKVAKEILYHEFVLGYGDSWLTQKYTWRGRLCSFMRAISQGPDLRESVKVVYIHTRLLKGHNHNESRDLLKAAACGLGVDLSEAWRGRASQASTHEGHGWPRVYEGFLTYYLNEEEQALSDAQRHLKLAFTKHAWAGERLVNAELIAMLIAQLPNLEYLSIQGDSQFPSAGLPKSALPALGIQSLSLKKLDLGLHGDSIIQLAGALETLNIHQYRFASPFPCMPNLKTLRMTRTRLSTSELRGVLDACTGGLEVFEYEAGAISDDNGGFYGSHILRSASDIFGPSDFIRSLEPHRLTLRVLHLDLTQQCRHGRKIHEDLSFKDFSSLEHLYLDSTSLFNFYYSDRVSEDSCGALTRLLPASIISLAVKHEYKDGSSKVNGALLSLAGEKIQQPDKFPKLETVKTSSKNLGDSLERRFEAVGVDFDVGLETLSRVKPYLRGPNNSPMVDLHT